MNRRLLVIPAVTALLFATTACGGGKASGPAFQSSAVAVPADKGVVHFFRPNKFSGKGATIFLAVGSTLVTLENATYFSATLPPGKHQVVSNIYGRQAEAVVDVTAGGETFVRMEAVSKGVSLIPEAQTLPKEASLAELGTCKLATSKVVEEKK